MTQAAQPSSLPAAQNGFIDIHHHILWGVDDGPRSRQEATIMLALAFLDGTRHIVATPHFDPQVHCPDVGLLTAQVDELNRLCAERFPGLRISLGAEVMFGEGVSRRVHAGVIPTLAGGDHVLVEFAPAVPRDALVQAVRHLANGGYVTVIAHMERYPTLMRDPDFARYLKEKYGTRLQVNAVTFLTRRSFRFKRLLKRVMQEELIDFVASDAHDQTVRKTLMARCYEAISMQFDASAAKRLLITNAAPILRS